MVLIIHSKSRAMLITTPICVGMAMGVTKELPLLQIPIDPALYYPISSVKNIFLASQSTQWQMWDTVRVNKNSLN